MNPKSSENCSQALRRHPLVMAVACLLAGVALGTRWDAPVQPALVGAALFWLLWATAEAMLTGPRRLWMAHACLAFILLFAGVALGQLNQHYVGPTHVARFASSDEPLPITARLHVVTLPEGNSHGNLYWVGSLSSLFTQRGWIPASGDVRIKWRSGPLNVELHRGDLLEVYGWLKRPETAMNPGAMDMRQFLAADRIFAELRIPRARGVVLLAESGNDAPSDPLTRARLFLRGKLLEHTARLDVEAGYSMVALLLGYRDPVIEDVSQAFADAGVAHLLAISGSHIVFFTALVWGILRLLPMPPRRRELTVAFIVLIYVLATPCGPPVIRAAVALLMVLLARLLGRPRMLMNMLAAAAAIVVLLRPADLFNSGAQLSFICTAGLIVLAERLYTALSGTWLERERTLADLSGTAWARIKFRAAQSLCGLATANLIGAATAVPLVAFHFGRINLYAVFTGLVALPVVAVTMAASAAQLFLELTCGRAAAFAAPLSTGSAQVMVWMVQHLAAIPGAAIALRAPPAWLVGLMYALPVFWVMRRWIGASRAAVVNAAAAVLALTGGWYALTQPLGELRLETLSVGQGSSVLLRFPNGELWLLNAGSRDTMALLNRAVVPALRVQGVDHLDAMIVSALNTVAAQYAGAAIDRFHPPLLLTSPAEWQRRAWTFAGATIESALTRTHTRQVSVSARCAIDAGKGARLRILWPIEESPPPGQAGLVLMCEYRGRRILLLDPAASVSLGLLELSDVDVHADVIIFLGPQRGSGDAALRKLVAATGAKTLIFSGRTAPALKREQPGELNTAAGAALIRIDSAGLLSISRAPH